MANEAVPVESANTANHVVDAISNGGDRLITDAEKVTTEIVRRIDAVSPKVLEHLESVSTKVWELLVRRELLDGYFSLFWAVLLIILLSYLTKFFIRKWNNSKDESVGALYICGAPVILLLIIVLTYSGLDHILFPEYFAAQELINSINKLKTIP